MIRKNIIQYNMKYHLSPFLRRRLSFDDMKQDMINLVDYELNPCEFDNVGDFVAEACDILSYNYIAGLDVSNKDRDKFFFFLVDTFGEDLALRVILDN